MFTAEDLEGVKGLAFAGATMTIINKEGEALATVALPSGELELTPYLKYANEGETFEFDGVRLLENRGDKARPQGRGVVRSGANGDWRPSAEERERKAMELRMARLEASMDSKVQQAIRAATAPPRQAEQVGETEEPADTTEPQAAPEPATRENPAETVPEPQGEKSGA